MVALPGLRFRPALVMTQASTALSIVAPGGAAIGMAGSWAMLRSWGFRGADVTRAVTLTGVWNQLANLVYPVVALFLLKVNGGETALLGTAAFVGVAVLGVVVSLPRARPLLGEPRPGSRRCGRQLRLVDAGPDSEGARLLGRLELRSLPGGGSRPPSPVAGTCSPSPTFAGSLTVFLLLVLSLRAVGVEASQVSVVEAFAAWALVRIIGTIPITPGGFGVIELGLDDGPRRVRRPERGASSPQSSSTGS